MIILDISVPRNVAEEVGKIEFVTLFDVDDTEVVIRETIEKRMTEIYKAQEIVCELANEYMEWLASLNLSPTIRHIQDNFRKIHDTEFVNYRKFKNGMDRQPMQDYGNHISEKFTSLIIKNIKNLTDNGKNVEHLKILNELFELTIVNEEQYGPNRN